MISISGLQTGILLVTFLFLGFASYCQPLKHLQKALLPTLAIISIITFIHFGKFHQQTDGTGTVYHLHDLYHYTISGKYFSEIGYGRIYQCTALAFTELADEGVEVPPIQIIRDLKSRYNAISSTQLKCDGSFSPERWLSFKQDLKGLLQLRGTHEAWQKMLLDQGNNPPPSWAVIPTLLLANIDFTASSLTVLASLDIILILILLPVLIGYRMGIEASSLLMIMLTCTWFSSFNWTYGSFFRQVWLFSLVMGLVTLMDRRELQAGLWLALAALLRVFPVLLLIPALALIRDQQARMRFITGIALVSILLLVLSLLLFGLTPWRSFITNILTHGSVPYLNHLGYYQAIVLSSLVAHMDTEFEIVISAQLAALMQASYDQFSLQNTFIKVIGMFTVGWLLLTHLRANKSMDPYLLLVSGVTLTFLLVNIAHYYYSFIGVAVWLAWIQGNRLQLVPGFICLLAISLLPMMSMATYFQFFWVNLITASWLTCALGLLVFEQLSTDPPHRVPHPLAQQQPQQLPQQLPQQRLPDADTNPGKSDQQ